MILCKIEEICEKMKVSPVWCVCVCRDGRRGCEAVGVMAGMREITCRVLRETRG